MTVMDYFLLFGGAGKGERMKLVGIVKKENIQEQFTLPS